MTSTAQPTKKGPASSATRRSSPGPHSAKSTSSGNRGMGSEKGNIMTGRCGDQLSGKGARNKANSSSTTSSQLLIARRTGAGREKAKSVSPFRGLKQDSKTASAKQTTAKVTNFQDLIKLAAQNSTVSDRESLSEGKTSSSLPCSRDHSPLGKTLLDRAGQRGKGGGTLSSSRDHSPLGKALLDRAGQRAKGGGKATSSTSTVPTNKAHCAGGGGGGRGRGRPTEEQGGAKSMLARRPLRTPFPTMERKGI